VERDTRRGSTPRPRAAQAPPAALCSARPTHTHAHTERERQTDTHRQRQRHRHTCVCVCIIHTLSHTRTHSRTDAQTYTVTRSEAASTILGAWASRVRAGGPLSSTWAANSSSELSRSDHRLLLHLVISAARSSSDICPTHARTHAPHTHSLTHTRTHTCTHTHTRADTFIHNIPRTSAPCCPRPRAHHRR
jgi:hypothetical protein